MKHNTKVTLSALGIMAVAAGYIALCVIFGPGVFVWTAIFLAVTVVPFVLFVILWAWLDDVIADDPVEPKGEETDY